MGFFHFLLSFWKKPFGTEVLHTCRFQASWWDGIIISWVFTRTMIIMTIIIYIYYVHYYVNVYLSALTKDALNSSTKSLYFKVSSNISTKYTISVVSRCSSLYLEDFSRYIPCWATCGERPPVQRRMGTLAQKQLSKWRFHVYHIVLSDAGYGRVSFDNF